MATISPNGVTRFWSGIGSVGSRTPPPGKARHEARSLRRQIRHFEIDELPGVAMTLLGLGVQPDLAAILRNLCLHGREFHVVDIGRNRIATGGNAQDVLVAGMGFDT